MSNKYIIVEDDSITKYFKEIKHSQKLSSEEEVALSERIKLGDTVALDKLVTANLKFVVTIAKEYQGQGLPLCDLISEGNEGLLKAATKFDGDKGYRFISYAVWWIRQTIRDSLNNNSRAIRLPTNVVGKLYTNKKNVNEFMLKNGRVPEYMEDFTNGEGEYCVDDFVPPSCQSLSHIISYGENSGEKEVIDLISSESSTIYEGKDIKDKMVEEEIENILSTLTDRERDIIELYFGIGKSDDGVTLEVIGDIYGLTKERVRQIKDKAIKKLRHNVHKLAQLLNE